LAGICPYSNRDVLRAANIVRMKRESATGRMHPDLLFIAADLSSGGGVNKAIRDLAAIFGERLGADVTVVNARSDAAPSYAFPPAVRLEQNRRQWLFAYVLFLVRLRGRRPRIVIGSWTQDNILIALAFLFSRTKVVLVEHAPWQFHGFLVRVLRRIVYPLAAAVVVLNRHDLDHYRRYLGNVRLIPDPVIAPAATSETREKLILAVGHLEPLKNFEDAVRAMAGSGLEEEGWSLAIIGSGSREPHLRKLIAELGLKNAVIRPPTDLGTWYRRASILLLTSRLESFSLVLAEAMLSGVIPLAYASDGPSFILEEFPDHLVPIGDVGALTRRLATVARRSDLAPARKRLGASIAERFSPEIIAEHWRRLILTE
jgi:glycosyltransferase involved in cell wall biosynthesis